MEKSTEQTGDWLQATKDINYELSFHFIKENKVNQRRGKIVFLMNIRVASLINPLEYSTFK